MDSMLQCLLDSQDEAERKRCLDEIIVTHTGPLVRGILGEKLGFFLDQSGRWRGSPDAEDLYDQILLNLIQRLNDLQADPKIYAINNYRQFVISATLNACHSYLRGKSRSRSRLKNNLRALITRHKDFKIWKGSDRMSLCGFAAWEGKAVSAASSWRLAQLNETPETFTSKKFGNQDLLKVPHTKLIAEILRWVGGPIEFEDLVKLVALFQKIQDYPLESIEASDEQHGLQIADPTPASDMRLENQEMVRRIWEEVKQLPSNYRVALCFSRAGKENDDFWNLLLTTGAISLDELAAGLEMSLAELARLWLRLPMDNEKLAAYLGATRSQVIKWRFRALERLRERLGGKK
jgi:DNA-directed RNA polymerase specialized sigma24 family protein